MRELVFLFSCFRLPVGSICTLEVTMSDSRGNESALENEISVAVNSSGRKKIVYIWDMDETLILLKSLLDGTYAVGFSGVKDVQRGIDIGKMWENLILEVCDDYFFYDQVRCLYYDIK